ncbi:hypothetical protein ES705_31629 [subsurface metagenome]
MDYGFWDMVAGLPPELRDEREFQLDQAWENDQDMEEYERQLEESLNDFPLW